MTISTLVGIRREDKNRWERRVPVVPADVATLGEEHGMLFQVQSSDNRVFTDEQYLAAGAYVTEDLGACPVILAVKEIPASVLKGRRTYVFFSHTIKGQSQNLGMLRQLVELECSLIDYERVADGSGRRLIFFGKFAGNAGMVDTLWGLGVRLLEHEGLNTPFSELMPSHAYGTLGAAKRAIRKLGSRIREKGLPEPLRPFVVGLSGYGNTSVGAQEILDLLPVREVTPEQLLAGGLPEADARNHVYKVIFREEHMARPKDAGRAFDLQEYYTHPDRYESAFDAYVDRLTVLMNCIYWSDVYPRLVTRARLAQMFQAQAQPKLRFIGDISCDVEGAIEATVRGTDLDDPFFVFDPLTGHTPMGLEGRGVPILAVDNLPCEFPKEASEYFSSTLRGFLPALGQAAFSPRLDRKALPPDLERALVLDQGSFTEPFEYMERFL